MYDAHVSYCTIYAIDAAGDVLYAGTAKNNHGFAPHVWAVLAKKHAIRGPLFGGDEDQGRFWRLFNSGQLSERDNIVLGATYDRVFIARVNVHRVVDALRSFYEENSWVTSHDGYRYQVVETMLGVARVLDEVAGDVTCRGVCFNLCSANQNPWLVEWYTLTETERAETIAQWRAEGGQDSDEDPEDVEENGPADFEARPFNFDRDLGKKRVLSGEPWELFDAIANDKSHQETA